MQVYPSDDLSQQATRFMSAQDGEVTVVTYHFQSVVYFVDQLNESDDSSDKRT